MTQRQFCLAMVLLLAMFQMTCGRVMAEEKMQFGRFGTLTLYRPNSEIRNVTLFVSGDGGWNLGVIDMAKALVSLDTLVVGIDITHYLKEIARSAGTCTYAAADFEDLSHYLQKQLNLPRYLPPLLIGYSSGATLVYAVLAQAPQNTFQGAISMGFSPDLPLVKPFCRGDGLEARRGPEGKGYVFLPAPHLKSPWVALQGNIDQVCDAETTRLFVKKTGNARLVMLPKVGHGFSVQKNWMPQFKKVFAELSRQYNKPRPVAARIANLPVHEVRADKPGRTIAVLYSGDGGWAGLDRELAATLARNGVSVIGVDSLQYFWTARDPEGAALDLKRLLDYYQEIWQFDRVLLVGYSMGADVLPYLTNRLPEEWRQRIALVALLGPAPYASFEFHLSEWLGHRSNQDQYPVKPEIEKLTDLKVLCFYGRDEKDSLCPELDHSAVQLQPMEGGHHFGGNYRKIAEILIKALKRQNKGHL